VSRVCRLCPSSGISTLHVRPRRVDEYAFAFVEALKLSSPTTARPSAAIVEQATGSGPLRSRRGLPGALPYRRAQQAASSASLAPCLPDFTTGHVLEAIQTKRSPDRNIGRTTGDGPRTPCAGRSIPLRETVWGRRTRPFRAGCAARRWCSLEVHQGAYISDTWTSQPSPPLSGWFGGQASPSGDFRSMALLRKPPFEAGPAC
jgi:hypothetical protein